MESSHGLLIWSSVVTTKYKPVKLGGAKQPISLTVKKLD